MDCRNHYLLLFIGVTEIKVHALSTLQACESHRMLCKTYIVRGWYQTMVTYWMTASQNYCNSIPTHGVGYSILRCNHFLNTQSLRSDRLIQLRVSGVRKFWMGTFYQAARQTNLPFKETQDNRHDLFRFIATVDDILMGVSLPTAIVDMRDDLEKDDCLTVWGRRISG